MVNSIEVSQESPAGGSRTRKCGPPTVERHCDTEGHTSENRRCEDPQNVWTYQRHEDTECDESQAANVGKRTGGQVDPPPRLYVLPPFGRNEGRVHHKVQRAFLVAMLKRTDHDRKEHLPPEPESGLFESKSLEQITDQGLVIVDETAQECDSHWWRIGSRHVRRSFS